MIRRSRQLLLSAVAGVAIAATAALVIGVRANAADDKKAAVPAKPALSVVVTQPQRATMPISTRANGNVAAWQEASIGTEANGLRLAEVRVNVGDVVKRGQVLATFAPESMQVDMLQTRAAVAEAEATLGDAAANAERAKALRATGALSEATINQYVTAERTARARLDAQRAALQARQIRVGQTAVVAPDAGVISSRSATVGAVLPAGQELFRLIRQGRLEWRAEVSSSDLAQIKPGARVTVTPAGGEPIAGTVRMVAPTVDPQTRNGIVYVDLPAPGSARAGMFARGEFEVGNATALTLPQSAVQLREGFSYVFKVGPDNKVTQAKIDTGRRFGDRIEVTGGPRPRRARRRNGRRLPRRGRHRAHRRRARGDERQRRIGGAGDAAQAMINVSSWSIKNPIPGVLLFIMLTAIGAMSFRAMKIQNFPDIDLPTVTVTASLPGASPSQLETDVARKIENQIATPARRQAHLHLGPGRHLDDDGRVPAREADAGGRRRRPRRRLARALRPARRAARSDHLQVRPRRLAHPDLHGRIDPHGRRGAVVVRRRHGDAHPARRARRRRGDAGRRRDARGPRRARPGAPAGAERHRRRHLAPAAPDAARIVGRPHRRRRRRAVGADDRDRAVGRRAGADGDRAQRRPAHPPRPGRTRQRHRRRAALGGVPERPAGCRLRDRANARRRRGRCRARRPRRPREPQDGASRHQDHRGVQLRRPGRAELPGLDGAAVRGAALAVLVVFLFLRDWRATLVASTALPLSIIPAFWAMSLLGFTLNGVTLLALSLVVGILVDDAIVEIENIMRHLGMPSDGPPLAGHTPSGGGVSAANTRGPLGLKKPYQAAMEAADEIGLAVIATTFTLIAVFLPTAFMSGVPGKFFVQFGWTAAIAVFFSLVVARMLTPMMSAYILKPPKKPHVEGRWIGIYLGWMRWCLRHRILTTIGALIFFFGSLALVPFLPTGFIPPDDLSQTQVQIALPPGANFAQTNAAAEAARQIVARNPHVKLIYSTVGGGATGADPFMGGGSPEVRKATLTLNLTPRDERGGIKKQVIEQQLRDALVAVPGARINVGFGGSSEKYTLVLAGEDGAVLADAARRVEQELRTLKGIGNVTSTSSLARPELIVRPDSARAADLGVTATAIGETLRVATAGDYDQSLAKLNLAQRQVPIVVKLPAEARTDLDLLSRLAVPGARGPVMLGNVATLAIDSGPAKIDRYDRLRNINFDIELNQQPLGEVQAEALALPSLKNLPQGVTQTTVGDAEAMTELFDSFGLAMLTGVACIYIVLVLLFKDFVQPATILVALVLSIPGAFLALFLTRTALSMPSMIGLIMLMGIATKNSILLVEYAIMARRDWGMSRTEALLDACHKRARPIVMTTIAMGAGMMPIALGIGTDPSFARRWRSSSSAA
jgi:RND family efflux transporter MFP subunit